jgi:hypothetical protein
MRLLKLQGYQYCLPLLNCVINNCVITMGIQVYFAIILLSLSCNVNE